MTELFLYSLKVTLVFSSLLMFYYFYLRKLSFHFTNRFILLLFIPISLYLPLLDIGSFYSLSNPLQIQDSLVGDSSNIKSALNTSASLESGMGILNYLTSFYLIGLSLLLLRFLVNIVKMVLIVRKSNPLSTKNLRTIDNNNFQAFSFLKWIFISKELNPNASLSIILHERGHLKYGHSVDILLCELLLVFTWYNPFVYLYRECLKEIHEFQADEYVLKQGVDKIEYLELMKKEIFEKQKIAFSSTFWSPNIKSRITMITKIKNNNRSYFRYLFFVPLTIGILFIMSGFTGSEPSIFPINKSNFKKISSPFGVNRKTPYSDETKMHGGIDIVAAIGVEVRATGAGKVLKSKEEGKWGNLIIIDHGNGIQTWYAHLNDLMVEEGEDVKQGEIIAHVGNTGQSTNPHLHYEVRKSGERVDPQLFYKMAE